MTNKILLEFLCRFCSWIDNLDVWSDNFSDSINKYWVVCTSENESFDIRVESCKITFKNHVCFRIFVFSGFDQWYEKWSIELLDLDRIIENMDAFTIGFLFYSRTGRDNSYFFISGFDYFFSSGNSDSEDFFIWEIGLLEWSNRICRGGITSDNHDFCSLFEKKSRAFDRKSEYCLRITSAVRGSCRISKIEVFIFWHKSDEFTKNRESSESRIKHSNHR